MKKRILISLDCCRDIANSTFRLKSYYNDKELEPEGWVNDLRISILCLLGIVLIVPMGHMRHMDLTEVLQVVLRYHDLVTNCANKLFTFFKKTKPNSKVPQIQIMKVQAYLSGLNLYRGAVDGLDGHLLEKRLLGIRS